MRRDRLKAGRESQQGCRGEARQSRWLRASVQGPNEGRSSFDPMTASDDEDGPGQGSFADDSLDLAGWPG